MIQSRPYTKVNRAITEGRKRFLKAYQAIEAGDECERYAPILALLALGEASSAEVVKVRPHLRHCTACRATVRELHISAFRRAQLLLFPVATHPDGIRSAEELLRQDGIVVVPSAAPTPEAVAPELLDLGDRLILGLLERAGRLGRVKDEAIAFFHRSSASDVAAGVHIAASGGGGRISTVATLIGFCISGVGAGALCVATGVVKAPDWILPRTAEPAKPKPRPETTSPAPSKAKLAASARTTEVVATPTPTPRPRTAEPAPRRARDRSQGTGATSHESPPIAEPEAQSAAEFSIEQSAATDPRPPDPPPATGGGEFMP